MRHIDDFIDDRHSDDYAAWIFTHFRLPANLRARFDKFMQDRKLFCTCDGTRYAVIGASHFGDIWLTADFNRDFGYDRRVAVALCSEWSPTP